MQPFLRLFLWGLLASFVLNAIYLVASVLRVRKSVEKHGIAAVTFSVWSFLFYTVAGAVLMALIGLGVRFIGARGAQP